MEHLDLLTIFMNINDEMMIFINNKNAKLMFNTYRKRFVLPYIQNNCILKDRKKSNNYT